MARKAAQKKAVKAPPLDGCSIATSGKFPGTTQGALAERVTSLGGTVAAKVTSDTNFLIATEKDYEANSTKVKAATTHSVPVVTLEWLDECESTDTKVDETQYLLSTSSTAAAAPVKNQANGSKKRAATSNPSPATQDASQAKKPKIVEDAKVGDGQNAKSKTIAVSLDEWCPLANYKVWIDPDGLIWDASLNQTNASHNNNKFYKVQMLHDGSGSDFKTWTRWGRVGEKGQTAMLGGGSYSDAKMNFEKKFKDKSGHRWADRGEQPKPGKYAYVEKSYNPDSDEEDDDDADAARDGEEEKASKVPIAECTLEPQVQDLMKLIFNQTFFDATMSELNYDANKLPLGKLSKGTIARGFQALKDLAVMIDTPNTGSPADIERLSNLFYSVIPHAFGRNRPPVIHNKDLLKKEIDLLESLSDMKEAAAMLKSSLKDDGGIHQLDRQFQGLKMNEMSPLDQTSTEFTELATYLNDSKGATHYLNYKVEEIFRIERQGEFDRFEQSEYAKVKSSNRRLLWHGSRVTNFGGILGQGLRIAPPEAPVSGYMFGKGIYLADMSSKSANYCCSYTSNNTALLLLCEAELGDPMHELTNSSYSAGEDAKAKGMCSTWGKGMTGPSKWKDAKCVNPALKGCMMPDVSVPPDATNVPNAYLQYNEFIAYDVAQIRLRYLFRVNMT
ncbi:poly polymerase catalytic domain-containing protein [Phaeosphaeriaceae sp. PMI808]|nr:poly polymerase catalytic domain-containing protein [Phaeosphaeriaceae sp. PMI808]